MTDKDEGKILPKIYSDALSPSIQEVGKTTHLLVRAALRPVNDLVLSLEKAYEWVIGAVAERIKERLIPDQDIVTPPPEIAGGVLLGLQAVGGQPELRELFANLLTTSMVASTKDQVHPAFIEVLRQLSAPEAKIVESFCLPREYPLLSFSGSIGPVGGAFVSSEVRNLSELHLITRIRNHDLITSFIDNLCRLGITYIDPSESPQARETYAALESRSELTQAVTHIREWAERLQQEPLMQFERQRLRLTAFGHRFVRCCVTPCKQYVIYELPDED